MTSPDLLCSVRTLLIIIITFEHNCLTTDLGRALAQEMLGQSAPLKFSN